MSVNFLWYRGGHSFCLNGLVPLCRVWFSGSPFLNRVYNLPIWRLEQDVRLDLRPQQQERYVFVLNVRYSSKLLSSVQVSVPVATDQSKCRDRIINVEIEYKLYSKQDILTSTTALQPLHRGPVCSGLPVYYGHRYF